MLSWPSQKHFSASNMAVKLKPISACYSFDQDLQNRHFLVKALTKTFKIGIYYFIFDQDLQNRYLLVSALIKTFIKGTYFLLTTTLDNGYIYQSFYRRLTDNWTVSYLAEIHLYALHKYMCLDAPCQLACTFSVSVPPSMNTWYKSRWCLVS